MDEKEFYVEYMGMVMQVIYDWSIRFEIDITIQTIPEGFKIRGTTIEKEYALKVTGENIYQIDNALKTIIKQLVPDSF